MVVRPPVPVAMWVRYDDGSLEYSVYERRPSCLSAFIKSMRSDITRLRERLTSSTVEVTHNTRGY